MSILSVTSLPFSFGGRPVPEPAAGFSFQEQLSAVSTQAQKEASPAAPSRDDLLSALFSLKIQRMQASKEVTEEQEDWEQLMDQLDAWVESLQENADIEKTARTCAAWAAAHMDTPAVKKGAASERLLEMMNSRFLG